MEKFEKDYTIRYNTRDRKTKKEAYDNVFTVTAYTEINAINKLLNMLEYTKKDLIRINLIGYKVEG